MLNGALDWAGLILARRSDQDDRGPSGRAVGGAAGRGAPDHLPRRRPHRRRRRSRRGRARRVPVGGDHRRAGALEPAQPHRQDGKLVQKQVDVLERLCVKAGVPARGAATRRELSPRSGAASAPGHADGDARPGRGWASTARWSRNSRTSSRCCPTPTRLNINTASAEVIAAVSLDVPDGLAHGAGRNAQAHALQETLANRLKGPAQHDAAPAPSGNDIDGKTDFSRSAAACVWTTACWKKCRSFAAKGRTVTPVHRERINYVDTAARYSTLSASKRVARRLRLVRWRTHHRQMRENARAVIASKRTPRRAACDRG